MPCEPNRTEVIMPKKLREFGEFECRDGERRSGCEPVEPVCKEKMSRLREYVDTRFDANADALINRTKEIDAHLMHLNNAQSRLDADRQAFLRKAEYNIEHDGLKEIVKENKESIEKSVDENKKDMGLIREWKAGLEGKASRSNLISAIAVVLSLIVAILHFIQGLPK